MDFRTAFKNYVQASFPVLYCPTVEERRLLACVVEVAKTENRQLILWSATEGAVIVRPNRVELADTADPQFAFGKILDAVEKAFKVEKMRSIVVLRDVGDFPFDRDPVLARSMRDAVDAVPVFGTTLLVTGPGWEPKRSLSGVVVIDFDLPDRAAIAEIARQTAEGYAAPAYDAEAVCRALGGLTSGEIENALALSFVEAGAFEPKVLYREKVRAVRRTGLLSVVDPHPEGLAAIGGLDGLKDWVLERKDAWSERAKAFGVKPPKGAILCGIPGSGKSLAARAIGTALDLPTLRLDVGALFGSLVGESEQRCRDALALAQAMAPCVLQAEEVDKGFAGLSGGGGQGDGGTGRRVLGTILTWMQEQEGCFVVATANDVSALPPELLRKGRFDEIFAVDVPTKDERQAIFQLHLDARGVKPNGSDAEVQDMLAATENFTGSEIEAVVDDAMFEAFDAGEPTNIRHLTAAAHATVPLFKTAGEQIRYIREWGATRARAASRGTPTELPPAPPEPEMAVVAVGVVQQDTGRKIQSSPKGEGGKKN